MIPQSSCTFITLWVILHLSFSTVIPHFDHPVVPQLKGINWNSSIFSSDIPPNLVYTLMTPKEQFQSTSLHHITVFESQLLQSLPRQFDIRTRFPHCISSKVIINQGGCGACWAFASAGILADRLCISNIANIIPSPQYSINCDHKCLSNATLQCNVGCSGGYLESSLEFLIHHFVTTEQCIPYSSSDSLCPHTCTDGTPLRVGTNAWAASEIRRLPSEAHIQLSLFTAGSVAAGMDVYSDFETYKGGVYQRSACAEFKGRHAVKIIGWGEEEINATHSSKYWLCQNSWGSKWGENGFFRILRGENHCGIEQDAWEILVHTPSHSDTHSADPSSSDESDDSICDDDTIDINNSSDSADPTDPTASTNSTDSIPSIDFTDHPESYSDNLFSESTDCRDISSSDKSAFVDLSDIDSDNSFSSDDSSLDTINNTHNTTSSNPSSDLPRHVQCYSHTGTGRSLVVQSLSCPLSSHPVCVSRPLSLHWALCFTISLQILMLLLVSALHVLFSVLIRIHL